MFNLKKFKFCKNKTPKFYSMPESFLVKKRKLNFLIVWFLEKLKILLELIIRLKERNDEINKKILKELNLSEDLDVKTLGDYHKKEFRRLKYIFYSKNVKAQDFKEPEKFYLPDESFQSFSSKSKDSVIELFKSMRNKDEAN